MSDQLLGQVCRICGNPNNSLYYKVREMMFGFRDEFLYFQCTSCECLQIAQFPPDISKYYPENYYSLSQNEETKFNGSRRWIRLLSLSALVFNKTWFDKLLQKFYSPISLRILKGLHINLDTRILDVGCGSGQKFLFPLAELGLKKITGCDPFLEHDIEYANGLKIRKADIFSIQGEWDVITYHHVFEHVPDPLENLLKVNQLLSDKGVCILRMPTVSSFAWRHYRTNWVQLDAPRHYFLHSIKSAQYLATKAGMQIFKIHYDSTYKQFADSERYILNEHLRQPRKEGIINFFKRKMKKIYYKRLAEDMNRRQMGDQAAFFLKKV
jgi:2-polyprenyl-3-methyl-5-hydroxy-6-metoxy-1,4-benzoquinol methylase